MTTQAAIDALLAAGFVADGATMTQHVRIPTTRSPVFGGIGGEARTLGGRARFKKGARRATVGKLTVCFYQKEPGDPPYGFTNIRTEDIDAVRAEAAK